MSSPLKKIWSGKESEEMISKLFKGQSLESIALEHKCTIRILELRILHCAYNYFTKFHNIEDVCTIFKISKEKFLQYKNHKEKNLANPINLINSINSINPIELPPPAYPKPTIEEQFNTIINAINELNDSINDLK